MMSFSPSQSLAIVFPEVVSGGAAGLFAAIGLYVLISWLVCVSAAFFRVKEVQFSVGLISIGACMLTAFGLTGLCRTILPDVAASFTTSGLFLITAIAGAMICSVPLVQYFWNLTYSRGLFIIGGALAILMVCLVVFHLLLYPVESLPARFAVPLFQDHQPGLVE